MNAVKRILACPITWSNWPAAMRKRINIYLKRIEFYAVFLWIYLDNKNEI
jgi:hypothetical protein